MQRASRLPGLVLGMGGGSAPVPAGRALRPRMGMRMDFLHLAEACHNCREDQWSMILKRRHRVISRAEPFLA